MTTIARIEDAPAAKTRDRAILSPGFVADVVLAHCAKHGYQPQLDPFLVARATETPDVWVSGLVPRAVAENRRLITRIRAWMTGFEAAGGPGTIVTLGMVNKAARAQPACLSLEALRTLLDAARGWAKASAGALTQSEDLLEISLGQPLAVQILTPRGALAAWYSEETPLRRAVGAWARRAEAWREGLGRIDIRIPLVGASAHEQARTIRVYDAFARPYGGSPAETTR